MQQQVIFMLVQLARVVSVVLSHIQYEDSDQSSSPDWGLA